MLKCKNIHFMYNDKFANPTIDFINKHFPKENHFFLVVKNASYKDTCQKFPKGENIAEFVFDLLDPKDFIDKKLIFHSFFIDGSVNWLYNNQHLLKNSYWMVWGGDFYKAPTDEANTFVRQNIYGIGSLCDNDLVKQKYGSKHIFFDTCMAIAPGNDDDGRILSELRNKQIKKECIVIQVNHSADNSTLEMFDVLAKFKNENIRIKTILSYKTSNIKSNREIQEIIDKGYEIFGDKFSYLDKMILPDDYAEYLADNDIMILNINQQSGVGNIVSSILLGKKVFIKSEITTTQYFLNNKIKVFDTNKIKDMNFYEFCEMPEETILNNIKNTELLISEERLISDFSKVFNDICPTLNQDV